jgi:hypothetical protein
VKKSDAVERLQQTGQTINDLYARAWGTALYPTQHGWPASIASIAMIPVLSAASLGQIVTTAVAEQVPDGVYEKLPEL